MAATRPAPQRPISQKSRVPIRWIPGPPGIHRTAARYSSRAASRTKQIANRQSSVSRSPWQSTLMPTSAFMPTDEPNRGRTRGRFNAAPCEKQCVPGFPTRRRPARRRRRETLGRTAGSCRFPRAPRPSNPDADARTENRDKTNAAPLTPFFRSGTRPKSRPKTATRKTKYKPGFFGLPPESTAGTCPVWIRRSIRPLGPLREEPPRITSSGEPLATKPRLGCARFRTLRPRARPRDRRLAPPSSTPDPRPAPDPQAARVASNSCISAASAPFALRP
jgi:hypothetical protein